jgi:hypothetical protein
LNLRSASLHHKVFLLTSHCSCHCRCIVYRLYALNSEVFRVGLQHFVSVAVRVVVLHIVKATELGLRDKREPIAARILKIRPGLQRQDIWLSILQIPMVSKDDCEGR